MKNKTVIVFAVILAMAGASALVFLGSSLAKVIYADVMGNQARAEVVGDAPQDSLEGFEFFTAGDAAFDVGVNVYGKVVFLDNAAALKSTKVKCALAIEEMRNQAPDLGRFNKGNIISYSNYIWQTNWEAVDEEVFLQRQFLSRFLNYYENGDPKE